MLRLKSLALQRRALFVLSDGSRPSLLGLCLAVPRSENVAACVNETEWMGGSQVVKTSGKCISTRCALPCRAGLTGLAAWNAES
eukprot:1590062-Pleurochrysis_carterae.AAC.2